MTLDTFHAGGVAGDDISQGLPRIEELFEARQPKGQADYLNALTIKSDYPDFAKLSMKEKNEIFSELEALDTYSFSQGKMIYFINLDKDNNEVPTILILTDSNIYRATFSVLNKQTPGYFEYRKAFEEIISTFALVIKIEKK